LASLRADLEILFIKKLVIGHCVIGHYNSLMTKVLITPSILSADLAHLQDEIDTIEKHADWIQVDVMDGHFVPNLTFGAPVMKCVKTKLPLDIHLMVSNPEHRVEEFLAIGAKNITFHAEALQGTHDRKTLIDAIHVGGATAGIALNPETTVSEIDDVIDDVDLVLVMSINPGFSGQKFMESVLSKVAELHDRHPKLMIQMDGGIDAKTAARCREAGANNLVSASFIFGAKDRVKAIEILRGS
jgi:ribulose-phosphate 3-epimerase